MEELYASGFNAWGQLNFENIDSEVTNAPSSDNVDDLREFTCVLRGSAITHVRAFLSHTILNCNGTTKPAGYIPKEHSALRSQDPPAYFALAQTSIGSVAILDQAGAVHQYDSLHDLVTRAQPEPFPALPPCTHLTAYDTGFAALTPNGSVYTWGDERYSACLGRDISEVSAAETPGLVMALQDLPTGPIAKIAAGGYMLAALTTGNDLYLWGGHPGRGTVPADVTEEPAPVVIEESDVADVAVGEAHLIVLTTDAKVFVIGDNGNGQLGLPVGSTDSWRQVELNLQEGRRAVGVAAGPRNSFIIIKGG